MKKKQWFTCQSWVKETLFRGSSWRAKDKKRGHGLQRRMLQLRKQQRRGSFLSDLLLVAVDHDKEQLCTCLHCVWGVDLSPLAQDLWASLNAVVPAFTSGCTAFFLTAWAFPRKASLLKGLRTIICTWGLGQPKMFHLSIIAWRALAR